MRPLSVSERSIRRARDAAGSALRFAFAASKLALRGLIVASVMGVVFGLVIGVGGLYLGVDVQKLYVIGGMSGWVSSFIAMMFVFSHMRRNSRIQR